MKNYKQFRAKLLKNKETKQSYEKLGPQFALIEIIIKKRIEKGITQKELAQRIGTKQSSVSRLESGAYNPSFSFLKKIASGLDAKLKVSLVEK
ncbi:helix-turn-helix transcriptional regulator [Patescibacteria group bacterium]|nr:helix-turn-helix transcriptional regulator [Patescibacteria group bacterium]